MRPKEPTERQTRALAHALYGRLCVITTRVIWTQPNTNLIDVIERTQRARAQTRTLYMSQCARAFGLACVARVKGNRHTHTAEKEVCHSFLNQFIYCNEVRSRMKRTGEAAPMAGRALCVRRGQITVHARQFTFNKFATRYLFVICILTGH